ncbi:hypothetical protein, partial [Pseudomonas nitroreducens]|uniref:hypothetical protein n=1 Tax=Pseudomonas nitroreducens TaxID=46680 RepID=UPI001F1F33EF
NGSLSLQGDGAVLCGGDYVALLKARRLYRIRWLAGELRNFQARRTAPSPFRERGLSSAVVITLLY